MIPPALVRSSRKPISKVHRKIKRVGKGKTLAQKVITYFNVCILSVWNIVRTETRLKAYTTDTLKSIHNTEKDDTHSP